VPDKLERSEVALLRIASRSNRMEGQPAKTSLGLRAILLLQYCSLFAFGGESMMTGDYHFVRFVKFVLLIFILLLVHCNLFKLLVRIVQ
jgi:hypothetical protein